MATAVEVRDLKAWFGKAEALHGINIAIESKHATAVIGPSGCGKSTFIRCLNRMHETNPEATADGEVKIGGDDIFRLRWVGRPGRQIITAPSDPSMAATIEAFAAESNPKPKSDDGRHAQRVHLPVTPVDPCYFAAVANDLGGSRNRGTVVAPHIANNSRVPPRPLYFVRIPRSEEFDLSAIYKKPHVYFLQLAGCLVGPEPLGVSSEGTLQFWCHRFLGLGCR